MAAAEEQEPDLIKRCLRQITCDGPGCKKRNPQFFCTNCNLVHYCSPDCRSRHEEAHTQDDCMIFARLRSQMLDQEMVPSGAANPSCGICLANGTSNQIALKDCRHMFCFQCLKRWNEYQKMSHVLIVDRSDDVVQHSKQPCPLCRSNLPSPSERLLSSAMCHMAAAQKPFISTENYLRCCQLAKKDLETLKQSDWPYLSSNNIRERVCLLEGEIALVEQDYGNSQRIFQRILLRLDKQVTVLSEEGNVSTLPTSHAEICLWLKIGQAQRLQGQYDSAELTYDILKKKHWADLTPDHHVDICMSLSECSFHLGNYSLAIDHGEEALKMNRYFPWSHKFVALAYLKLNNLAEAIRLASEAIIYEVPWDFEHLQEIEAWYRNAFGSISEEEVLASARRIRRAKLMRFLSILVFVMAIVTLYVLNLVRRKDSTRNGRSSSVIDKQFVHHDGL